MSDNENIVVEEPVEQPAAAPVEPVQKEPFSAKLKEWFRKKMVGLKRSPQTIALLFLLIPSLIYILGLGSLSESVLSNRTTSFSGVKWLGHAIFVNTLFSILILLLFLNTFPKRKKPNLVFAALVFVFAILMILMDVLFYTQLKTAVGDSTVPTAQKAMNISIVHIVFQGISMVVFALIPVYSKLLMKINTRKEVASNEIKEEIDLQED